MGADSQIEHNHVVFFDGVCNLCNSAVDRAITHDRDNVLYYASLQSDYAKENLLKFNVDLDKLDTILYLENGVLYEKSSAVLEIAKHLTFYNHFYFLRIIPKWLRDKIYNLVAQSRYRVFGKKSTCRLPTPSESERFLDS